MARGARRANVRGKVMAQCDFNSVEETDSFTLCARKFSDPEKINMDMDGTQVNFRKYSRVKEDVQDDEEPLKRKGIEGIIEIENPNIFKVKDPNQDFQLLDEVSPEQRAEVDKQKGDELQQKTAVRVKNDLDRLSIIRQQRLEAAMKREEEKAAKEAKKAKATKKIFARR